MARVDGEGLVAVGFAEGTHGVLDAALGDGAELGAMDVRVAGGARGRAHDRGARVHHLEADVLPLAVAVEPEDEVRGALRLALEVLDDARAGARLLLLHGRVEEHPGVEVPALELGREVDGQDVAEDRGDAKVAQLALELAPELVHVLAPATGRVRAVREEVGDGGGEGRLLRHAQHHRRHVGAKTREAMEVARGRPRARRHRRRVVGVWPRAPPSRRESFVVRARRAEW